jgi:hypothetical protein
MPGGVGSLLSVSRAVTLLRFVAGMGCLVRSTLRPYWLDRVRCWFDCGLRRRLLPGNPWLRLSSNPSYGFRVRQRPLRLHVAASAWDPGLELFCVHDPNRPRHRRDGSLCSSSEVDGSCRTSNGRRSHPPLVRFQSPTAFTSHVARCPVLPASGRSRFGVGVGFGWTRLTSDPAMGRSPLRFYARLWRRDSRAVLGESP